MDVWRSRGVDRSLGGKTHQVGGGLRINRCGSREAVITLGWSIVIVPQLLQTKLFNQVHWQLTEFLS